MQTENRHSDCKTFLDRLSRYADGDLGPAESKESRRHLDACPKCAAALEAHKTMILLLESSKEVEAPWDLDVKVLEAIGFGGARTQLRGYRVSPPVVWAASVAAMVLLGAGGLAVRSGIARFLTIVFGPAGVLSTGEMAGLASKITGYLLTVWDGFIAGLEAFQPLARSFGMVSDAAKGNPVVIGTIVATLALVLLFFRIMTKGKRSRATSSERSHHAGN
jgi:anti-sigma factor (TIGR02949 family)